MDTKSTKFKYTNLSKAICLLLAALLFSLGTWCAVELGAGSWVFGTRKFFAVSAGESAPDYTDTQAFETVFTTDMSSLASLTGKNEKAYGKAMAKAQKATVESVVKQYIARQEYLLQRGEDPEDEYFERDPVVHFPGGEDYEVALTYSHMALSEEEVREELNRQYDDWEVSQLETYVGNFKDNQHWLEQNGSLRYYVRSVDGTVYTNLSSKPSVSELEKHKVYGASDAKRDILEGVDFLKDSPEYSLSSAPEKAAIYFYLNDDLFKYEQTPSRGSLYRTIFEEEDEYIATKQLYDVMKERPAEWVLAIMVLSYLCGLALLLWFLHLVGHVNSDRQVYAEDGTPEPVRYAKDGSRLTYAAIDKLPGDVHFLVSGALFSLCLGIPLSAMVDASHTYSLLRWFPLGGALITLVCILILAEWLASVCRTVKSGRGFWKNTIVIRLLRWCWGVLKKFVEYCKTTWHLTEYTPKHLHKHTIYLVAGYVLCNFILAALLAAGRNGTLGVIMALALIAFNVWVLSQLIHYVKGLDQIIEGSEAGAEMADLSEENLPVSLKTLAGNMAVSRERIDAAVSKAVKEEQTRTELITNVTHDLKTPLTSLINYSDLLARKAEGGELGDEESTRYVGVIHDQSEKLKRLIDDLLEASKVSTGNVQLNLSPLNLTELAAQAIAEFAPEMTKNGNEVVFVDGSGQPAAVEHRVYADGSKTYRLLANLLSNAQKYSAPGTRVYATVSDGPAGADGLPHTTIFELKNTSAAPLNISAEELMARFVRGDRSRGETEGNGLGLSIARDLADLMGGRLDLTIDGDLFKATVTLPKE